MGDRGNIGFKTDACEPLERKHVWLYSHWNGSELLQRLQNALKSNEAQSRKDDAPYLTRILIDRVLTDHDSETGWGISTSINDNEHPIIEVDCEQKMIFVRKFNFDRDAWDVDWDAEPLQKWTFDDFVTVDLESLVAVDDD